MDIDLRIKKGIFTEAKAYINRQHKKAAFLFVQTLTLVTRHKSFKEGFVLLVTILKSFQFSVDDGLLHPSLSLYNKD